MERGFSINNKVLNVNFKEVSITSRRLIIDHMNSNNLLPQSYPITKSLLTSVSYSRQRYQNFLRGKDFQQNSQCAQLAIIDKEIREVKDYCRKHQNKQKLA